MAEEDWQHAWDGARAAVGQDFSDGAVVEAIDEIELGSVRKFCEPLEFDCPLHYDEHVAREHGYRGVLAPLSGVSSTWLSTGSWRPGDPTQYPSNEPDADIRHSGSAPLPAPFPPTVSRFVTDLEIEYFEPACVGDRLRSRGRKLLSVVPKQTRVGCGAFVRWERDVINQRGELVAQVRSTAYGYDPVDPPGGRPPASSGSPAASATVLDAVEAEAVEWSRQRYWEDVAEGEAVPAVAIHLTVARLVVEAAANQVFNPTHHNTPFSKARGAPDMYANNVFIQGWWERCVREFIGLAGRIRRVGPFRINGFNVPSETAITGGRVVRKWEADGEHLVELELRTEASGRITVGPAPVLVSLPSRR